MSAPPRGVSLVVCTPHLHIRVPIHMLPGASRVEVPEGPQEAHLTFRGYSVNVVVGLLGWSFLLYTIG